MRTARDHWKVFELPRFVQADVPGPAEAIVRPLVKLGNEEARALHSGVGAITVSDIGLAE